MNEMVVIKNNEIIVDATVIEKIKDFFLFDGEQIEELTKYSKESKEE